MLCVDRVQSPREITEDLALKSQKRAREATLALTRWRRLDVGLQLLTSVASVSALALHVRAADIALVCVILAAVSSLAPLALGITERVRVLGIMVVGCARRAHWFERALTLPDNELTRVLCNSDEHGEAIDDELAAHRRG